MVALILTTESRILLSLSSSWPPAANAGAGTLMAKAISPDKDRTDRG